MRNKGGRRPRQIGKHFELEVAKRLGCKRAGYGNASTMPDLVGAFNVECKVTSQPKELEEALATVKARSKDDKLQIVVLKERGASWTEARVYLSFNDFKEHYG